MCRARLPGLLVAVISLAGLQCHYAAELQGGGSDSGRLYGSTLRLRSSSSQRLHEAEASAAPVPDPARSSTRWQTPTVASAGSESLYQRSWVRRLDLDWCINIEEMTTCTTTTSTSSSTQSSTTTPTSTTSNTTTTPTTLTTTSSKTGTTTTTLTTTTLTTTTSITATITTTSATTTLLRRLSESANTTTVTGSTTTTITATATTSTATTTTITATTITTTSVSVTTTSTATSTATTRTTTTTLTTTATTTATTSTATTVTTTLTTTTTATTTPTTTTVTTTTTTTSSTVTSTTTITLPPCLLGAEFPVGGCGVILNGGTCEAQTEDHECMEQGNLTFHCPDLGAESETANGSWSENLTIGEHWGQNAYFSTWGNSMSGRTPNLVASSGGFDVKCRVCGLAMAIPQDLDSREGYIRYRLSFGPNLLNGSVDEARISGYAIYLVSTCHEKLSSRLAFVTKVTHTFEGAAVPDVCSCPSWLYTVEVASALPSSHMIDGLPNGIDVRLMVAPVTTSGYELPIGATTAILQDHFTTTFTTTTVTTSSTSTTTTTTSSTSTSTSSTTTSSTTNTTTVTSTTTTTTTPATAFVEGSIMLEIDSESAAAFAADPEVTGAISESLSNLTGVPAEFVSVTLVLLSRRLALTPSSSGSLRRLASDVNDTLNTSDNLTENATTTTTVRADYSIRVQDQASMPRPSAVVAALRAPGVAREFGEILNTALSERVGAGIYEVSVTDMTDPTVWFTSAFSQSEREVVQPQEEGKSAVAPVAITLSLLAAMGGVGGFLLHRHNRKNAGNAEKVQPCDPAEFFDEKLDVKSPPDELRAAAQAEGQKEEPPAELQ